MIKIIYIMGAGRSGTTLLDIILGNAKNGASCGELNRIPRRKGIPPGRKNGEYTYKFWDALLCQKKFSFFCMEDMAKLFEKYEYHSNFMRFLIRRPHDTAYINFNTELFKSLANELNGKYIIDSSKYPGRALAMSEILPNDEFHISYIYLKRDPVAVVRSFQKQHVEQPPKGYLISCAYYFVVNLLCALVVLKLKAKAFEVITIRYEDICNLDEDLFDNFENIGLNFEHLRHSVLDKEKLVVGALFDGNRIRLKESIVLKKPSVVKIINRKEQAVRCINRLFYP